MARQLLVSIPAHVALTTYPEHLMGGHFNIKFVARNIIDLAATFFLGILVASWWASREPARPLVEQGQAVMLRWQTTGHDCPKILRFSATNAAGVILGETPDVAGACPSKWCVRVETHHGSTEVSYRSAEARSYH